ncbi:unnamed protein product, partial [Ixodes persulcatus]
KLAIDADSIDHQPGGWNAKERTLLDCGHAIIETEAIEWQLRSHVGPHLDVAVWHRDLMIPEEPEAWTADNKNHSELNNGR